MYSIAWFINIGLHFWFQKTDTISIFIEDLSRIQSFLETKVKLYYFSNRSEAQYKEDDRIGI